MYVSPQKASFKKGMRGYKARQVDAYIESLCSDFAGAEEDYQSRIVALEKEIAQLRESLDEKRRVEEENEALRSEIARLRSRRFVLHRQKNVPELQSLSDKQNGDRPAVDTPAKPTKDTVAQAGARAERARRFFRAGAEFVRIAGNTGRYVTRLVNALPSPATDTKAVPAPTTAKQAKQLARTLAENERKQARIARKASKMQKKEHQELRKAETPTK